MDEKVRNLEDLESMPEFKCGLWYSPYVKIYSIGGRNRIAEISNYPRAYKDTTSHVYTEDTPFIVNGGDLNDEVEGERVHRDSQDNIFRVGEEAIHHKGDPLPGAFPRWLESEDLPFTADPEEVSREVAVHTKLGLPAGKVILTDKPADKQIIRIKYQRVF